jgi:hypothetical protein
MSLARSLVQDLKDHMRKAGDIGFADVFGDRSGVVDFHRKDDMVSCKSRVLVLFLVSFC